jgi:hypothetical protein
MILGEPHRKVKKSDRLAADGTSARWSRTVQADGTPAA